jgi:DNA-binding MarR family transcriptional regulator
MSIPQTTTIPFGRHLGVAGRAARALLDTVLVDEATTYETWIALNLLATGGPAVRREVLQDNLAVGLEMKPAAIAQLLGQLERFGVIRAERGKDGGAQIAFTAEGAAYYQHLLEAVNRRSAQVLGSIDPDDLQITIRVLGQFRVRAEALLAG